jgi:ankyrin repeat protein
MRLVQIERVVDGRNKYSLTNDLSPAEVIKRPYVVMSHTWSLDDEEYVFADFKNGTGTNKAGYRKFEFCGEQAARDGYDYFWIDTVCIDKSNLVELDKALNSMFRWYRDSEICYVYLADVSARRMTDLSDYSNANSKTWRNSFRTSRWWTRGWTLQELIAPPSVFFYSVERMPLGDKDRLQSIIYEITNIPKAAFLGKTPLSEFSVAERFKWASNRKTKEEEDEAYCLLGIFDIYMRPTYGIGEKALIKLKEKVGKLTSPVHNQPLKLFSDRAVEEGTTLAHQSLTGHGSIQPHAVSSKIVESHVITSGDLSSSYRTCSDLLNFVETQLDRQPDSDRWHAAVQFKTQKKKFEDLAAKTSRFQGSSLLASTIIENLLNSISEEFDQNELKRFHLDRTNSASAPKKDQTLNLTMGKRKMTGLEGFEKPPVTENNSRWSSERRHGFATNVNSFTDIVKTLHDMVGGPSNITSANQQGVYMDYHIQSILEGKRYQYQQHVREEIISWLGMASFDQQSGVFKHYENQLSSRLSGTCEWIFSEDQYLSWVSNEFPDGKAKIIWINGGPGFGKSVLCAKVVEKFKSEAQDEALVGFFFSSPHAASSDDLMFVVKSWLAQLIAKDEKILAIAHDCFNDSKELVIASDSSIWKILKTILTERHGVTLFLDGFDEYSRTSNIRAKFLQDLKRAASNTATRIFVTSREEPEFKPELSPGMNQTPGQSLFEIRITKETVRDDVKLFSHSVVNKKLPGKDQVLKDKLATQLADKCDGMFLWIKLQEEQLRGGKNGKKLEKIVQNMPTGLTSTYERNWNAILNRGDLEDKERAFAILRWTMLSLRPLSIAELSQALTVKVSELEAHSDPDEMPDEIDDTYIEEEIVDLCGALVEVRNEKGISDPGSRTIHLIHASVREFLQSVLPAGSGNGGASLDKHHDYLARTCLAFLSDASEQAWDSLEVVAESDEDSSDDSEESDSDSDDSDSDDSDSDSYDSKNLNADADQNAREDSGSSRTSQGRTVQISQQFLDYTLKYWSSHMALSGKNEKISLPAVEQFTSLSNACFQRWAKKFEDARAPDSSTDHPIGTPLYYAALFELAPAMESIWEKEIANNNDRTQLEKLGGRYGTPLQAACAKGNQQAFDLLMKWNAAPDSEGGRFGRALNAAAAGGRDEMVAKLIKAGAQVEFKDPTGRTALHSAAKRGYLSTVKLLIESGSEIDTGTTAGDTALLLAAENGNLEVVNYLISKGADHTRTNDHKENAAWLAAWNGHSEVLKVFIDKGTDYLACCDCGSTPISMAAGYGHLAVIELLIAAGMDLNNAENHINATICNAARYGHTDVVKCLVEAGVDMNILDEDGQNSLLIAIQKSNIETATYLIEAGADLSIESRDNGDTPLLEAANKGNLKMVQLLLSKGADINQCDKKQQSPIRRTSFENHFEVFKFLYEAGADVMKFSEDGYTPLTVASSKGFFEIVQYLQEKGADLNLQTTHGASTLYLAAAFGSLRIVELLLDKSADFKASTKTGWSPLHIASQKGHIDIVKLLIQKGADLEARTTLGLTPLNVSGVQGRMESIVLLLESGADITAPDDNGNTPICYAAANGQLEIVKELFKRGADPSDGPKHTPLCQAASKGHVNVMQFLCDDAGVDAKALKDIRGSIMVCAMDGGFEAVRFIVEKGVDLNVANSNNWTTLHQAIWANNEEVVKLLLEHGANCNISDNAGRSSLRNAITAEKSNLVDLLLKHGADPMAIQQAGQLPAHVAARSGNVQLLKRMTELLKDPFIKDTNGRTLLHNAAVKGETACMEYLLSKEFSCKDVDNFGKSAFHYACISGSLSAVELILKHDPSPNLDNSLWSPLHWAHRKGTPELVKFLEGLGVRAKSVQTLQPAWSWTPSSIAKYHHNANFESDSTESTDESKEKETLTSSESEVPLPEHAKHGNYTCDHCFDVSFLSFVCSSAKVIDSLWPTLVLQTSLLYGPLLHVLFN